MSDQQKLRLLATVSELLAYLGVEQEPESFLRVLSSNQSIGGKNEVPLAEQIAQKASQLSQDAPNRFVSVYERLSNLNRKELEPLLYILNQVHTDPEISNTLSDKNKEKESSPIRTPYKFSTPATGLSKSRSSSHLSGITFTPTTPRMASLLSKQRSMSNIISQTPGSSRIQDTTLRSQIDTTPTQRNTSRKSKNSMPFSSSNAPLLFQTKDNTNQHETKESDSSARISSLSTRQQEQMLIEDLLYVLLGIEGEYIKFIPKKKQAPIRFQLKQNLNLSLTELVNRILPICTFYLNLVEFVENHSIFDYGRSHHALAATIRDILQEYHILVAQLEHSAHSTPEFTIQKMWFYLGPTFDTLDKLNSLISIIEEQEQKLGKTEMSLLNDNNVSKSKSGGVLLTLIADQMIRCGGTTKSLYAHLLSNAAKPYFAILKEWVCHGHLDDPYAEFMIQERVNLSKELLTNDYNETYWEQRYTIHHELVPSFLMPYQDKILLTGKYLNVLRECSLDVKVVDTDIEQTVNSSFTGLSDAIKIVEGERFLKLIDFGYSKANSNLLDFLRKQSDLLGHLKSIKTFFLLGQSDFLTHFLDVAMIHLGKPATKEILPKINSLLELVVRSPSTVSSTDPYKDHLVVELSSMTLFDQLLKINSMVGLDMKKHMQNIKSGSSIDVSETLSISSEKDFIEGISKEQLTGIDAITLGYRVTFPITLVLNKKVLTKYQMLFRHLFKCKYLERLLGSTWLDQTKVLNMERLQKFTSFENQVLTRSTSLCGKMLHFIQQIIYFMFFEVIDPHWTSMQLSIKTSTTVDGMLKSHEGFLDTCLKECMLTNPKLIAIFSSLQSTCHSFVKFAENITTSNEIQNQQKHSLTSSHTISQLDRLEHSFLLQIQSLIDCVQVLGVAETARLRNLVTQLDFNNYYKTLVPSNTFIKHPIVPTR